MYITEERLDSFAFTNAIAVSRFGAFFYESPEYANRVNWASVTANAHWTTLAGFGKVKYNR